MSEARYRCCDCGEFYDKDLNLKCLCDSPDTRDEIIRKMKGVLEFYASKENWDTRHTYDCDVYGVVDDSDLSEVQWKYGNFKASKECGGLRARKCLKELEGME